ncbi:hypothetical protein RhiJN_25684 [Ceratobasidium sp. AG-Ba]|nr:hypothetical protein RhiJN_25684 [Ceratobasidium sp. AG-Ba]
MVVSIALPWVTLAAPAPANDALVPGTRGGMCAGIANIQCDTGLYCCITETYPDASGICVSRALYLRCPPK